MTQAKPNVPEGRLLRIGSDGSISEAEGTDGHGKGGMTLDLGAAPIAVTSGADVTTKAARSLRIVAAARGLGDAPASSAFGNGTLKEVVEAATVASWDDSTYADADAALRRRRVELAAATRHVERCEGAAETASTGRVGVGFADLSRRMREAGIALGRASDQACEPNADMPTLLAKIRSLSSDLHDLCTDTVVLAYGGRRLEGAAPVSDTGDLLSVGLALHAARRAGVEAERNLKAIVALGTAEPAEAEGKAPDPCESDTRLARARSKSTNLSGLMRAYASTVAREVDTYERKVAADGSRKREIAFYHLGHECGRTGHVLRTMADDLRKASSEIPRSAREEEEAVPSGPR